MKQKENRNVFVQIRLTKKEKELLLSNSTSKGFKSITEYIKASCICFCSDKKGGSVVTKPVCSDKNTPVTGVCSDKKQTSVVTNSICSDKSSNSVVTNNEPQSKYSFF